MSLQNEVRWLLDLIKEAWPSYGIEPYGDEYGGAFPSNTVRIDRDEPRILETGERKKRVKLDRYNVISATLANRDRQPIGTEFDYHVETVLNVRIEGANASTHGQLDDSDHFNYLVAATQYAIGSERSYPDVDPDGSDFGRVQYVDARIENEQNLSNEDKDYYRADFDVRLRGYDCR